MINYIFGELRNAAFPFEILLTIGHLVLTKGEFTGC